LVNIINKVKWIEVVYSLCKNIEITKTWIVWKKTSGYLITTILLWMILLHIW